jgi:hypothetical protein
MQVPPPRPTSVMYHAPAQVPPYTPTSVRWDNAPAQAPPATSVGWSNTPAPAQTPSPAPTSVGWDYAPAQAPPPRPTSVRPTDNGVICWWEDNNQPGGSQASFEPRPASISLEMKQETVITNREEITRAKEQNREAAQIRVPLFAHLHSQLFILTPILETDLHKVGKLTAQGWFSAHPNQRPRARPAQYVTFLCASYWEQERSCCTSFCFPCAKQTTDCIKYN